jgi:hypothetical protein
MREIKIVPGGAPARVHGLVAGLSGSGKTSFAASAPKPLFISDVNEGGYNTLFAMDPAIWWDSKVAPEVHAIEKYTDMSEEISKLEQMAAKKTFPWQTLVIDPLSVYVDRFLGELMAQDLYKDSRKYYGDLASHIQALVRRVHALPCHVLWLCHVKHDGSEVNGPHIGGQMAEKFPAYCDFKWLTNVVTQPNAPPVYELRTLPYRTWTFLGGRWPLYDPMIPSFKCISQLLGLGSPVSPSVPGFPNGVTYPPRSANAPTNGVNQQQTTNP